MQRCLELAAQAKANGKTAVGSVITRKGKIIAEGSEGDPQLPSLMSHAENIALLKAIEHLDSRDLSSCELYTTVEPCYMCTYLIRQTRIKKVVYGTTTPAGGASSTHPILKTTDVEVWDPPPQIVEGVLKEECMALLQK